MTKSIKIEIIIFSEFNSTRTITGTDLDNPRNLTSNLKKLNYNNISNLNLENLENKKIGSQNLINNNSNYLTNFNSKSQLNQINCKNSFYNSNSNKNNIFNNKIYSILPVINSIKKIIVNSQYLYTIPNSTLLMSLVNINNFFLNHNTNSKNNTNYIISLYLTASCMAQSRLFIQSWELFNKLQLFLINYEDISIYSLIFRENFNQNQPNIFNKIKDLKNSIAAKIEIIKSVCMYEHGHIQPYLDSLYNAINIYYSGDYTTLKYGINWSKINDYNSDKFYVQNFLSKNGKKLIDLLLFCLNDKCELLLISTLKIIEYIIDYHPVVITEYFPKIIKSLLKLIYPISKINQFLDPKKKLCINNLNYEDFYIFLNKNKEYDEFIQIFLTKDIFFPKDLLLKFLSVNFDFSEINNKNNINPPVGIENKNSISSILMKQINYTLDTIINNLDNLSFSEVNNIFVKTNRLLIEILKYDLDQNTNFNILKLIRKIYENINSSVNELGKSLNRNNHTEKQFNELISAILTISINPKIFLKQISDVNNINKNPNNFNNSKIKNISFSPINGITDADNYSNFFHSLKYFELFENTEKSNTILFALEKLSEINFLSHSENVNFENLNWIKLNIEIIIKYIKKNIDNFTGKNFVNNKNNKIWNNNLNLFCIFYLFLNLNLFKILYLEREDIKFHSIFRLKFKANIELIKPFLSILNLLLELEEITLQIKDCFFIFETLIEILRNLKKKFENFFDFNFNKIFIPQLKMLKNRLLEYGIFKENSFFLDKVLPFIDIESQGELEKKDTIQVLKEIFEVILHNFSNFYDEEIFLVYNQLLDKLSNYLDNDLIMKIVKSIVFKYNYKGDNFKNSTKKLYEIFVSNMNYFSLFKMDIVNSTKSIFLNSLVSESIQVNRVFCNDQNVNKQIYEYFEKLEFYKKFIEFVKEYYKSFDKTQLGFYNYLFYFSNQSQNFISTINHSFNETVYFVLKFILINFYIF